MLNRFEQFSSIISGINRCIRKIETEEMEKYGCKGAYAQYLITLAKNPEGLSLAKLSDICDKDKSAVSRYIFEMQEKNLVTKENKTSGKYNARITLTNDGYRAYEYIHTRAMDVIYSINAVKSVRNLLQYGLENTHYRLINVDGYDYAEILESSDYKMNLLYTGDAFNALYSGDWTHDVAINGEKQNDQSVLAGE